MQGIDDARLPWELLEKFAMPAPYKANTVVVVVMIDECNQLTLSYVVDQDEPMPKFPARPSPKKNPTLDKYRDMYSPEKDHKPSYVPPSPSVC